MKKTARFTQVLLIFFLNTFSWSFERTGVTVTYRTQHGFLHAEMPFVKLRILYLNGKDINKAIQTVTRTKNSALK